MPAIVFAVNGTMAQVTGMTGSASVYQTDCHLSSAKINVSGGVPPYTYHWSNGAIGDSVGSLSDGNYTVHVIDSDNTVTTPDIDVTFKVEVSCKVAWSAKFSPNGDGINDTWAISRVEEYPDFLLQIFDRWGQVVHEARKIFIPWDGTHLGIKVPDGTYYVLFFYDEGKLSKPEKGSLTIVR
ncbi:MAG: T9SS type B sorting domain-containing protein [Bacteroidia bacterium]